MDFENLDDFDDDEFDYVHDQDDDLQHNLQLAQQYLSVEEDEDMEKFQINHHTQATVEPRVSTEPELMYHSPEKDPPPPPLQSPEPQALQTPKPSPPPSLPSPHPAPIKSPEPQALQTPKPSSPPSLPSPFPPPIKSPEPQELQTPKPSPPPSLPSPFPPPIKSPEPQALQTPKPSPPPSLPSPPPSLPSPPPPPIKSPEPQSLPSPVSNIQTINDLLKTVPFLKIPLHFGFEINRKHNLTSDGSDVVEVSYTHMSQDNETLVTLKSVEDLHDYLIKSKIRIPISFFTFEPDIDVRYLCDQPFWAEIIHKDDLSEGMEKVPIPVICDERNTPGRLAKYATENVTAKHLKVEKIDDDGFLLCCDCENDCKDKMKCPCFLKTLDNCSKKTREFEGDENIGYKYQRLENAQISGIFECNRKCKCRTDTCVNRVIQNGLICKLQLFMTNLKGWGVRTLSDIPKGTYVTSYIGEIVSSEYADGVTRKWNEGRWKYLSILEVAHDHKEGYESDVVEPEDTPSSPLSLSESEGSTETVEPRLSNEEWNTFLSQEDDCDSPPDQDYFNRPSSPATSCFVSQSVFLGDEEEEENKVNETAAVNKKEFPKILRRKRKRVRGMSKADRILRSDDQFEENPKEFENLVTGRFEFRQRSLADHNLMQLFNKRSKRISKHVASANFQKRRKITTFILLDEFNKIKTLSHLGEMKKQREKEYMKREDKLKRSSRLSAQYVSDKVLPSIKQKLGENNSVEVTTKPSSPCASPFEFLVPPAPPPSCKLSSFGEKIAKKLNHGVSMGKGIKRVVGVNKIIQKARKGWGGGRRRRGGDLKKSSTKKKYGAKGKSILPGDHPLLQLNLNIDGIDIGNVGRYLNHSCNPNVFPQYVFTNTHDLRFPDIAFFAKRNIKAGEELTWNYGYEFEECDEEEGKKEEGKQEEDGSDLQNQEQGAGSDNEDAQQYHETDKDDTSVMSMTVEGLSPRKRLHTSILRKLVRMKTALGTRNKRKPFKRPRTRLPCYCGQDNCKGRLC